MNRYSNNTKIHTSETFNFMHNLTSIGLDNIEKIAKLQLKVSNDTLQQVSKAVRTFTSASSPQKLLEQTNEIAQEGIKTNYNNYQHFTAIVNDTKSQCLQAIAAQLELFKNSSLHSFWPQQSRHKEDYQTNNVANSLTKPSSAVVNEPEKSENKTPKATNSKRDEVSTRVKSATHSAHKAKKDNKAPVKKAGTMPQNHSSPKPAADNDKAVEKPKESAADKVVNEAKEAI